MTDELDTIHAALAKTGVYVHPSMAKHVDAAEVKEIEASIAASETPMFVIAYPFATDDQWAGEPEELMTRLHDRFDDPGLYVANRQIYDDSYGLVVRTYDLVGPDTSQLDYRPATAAEREEPSDLGAGLAALTDMVATDTVAERYDDATADLGSSSGGSTGSSTPGEDRNDSGGDPSGLLIAGLVVAVVVAVGWGLLRRPRRGRNATFVLPESAVDRIRHAHDRRLARRADDEVLALGEAIDAAEIGSRNDTMSWQAALDHYDGARRVLGHDDGAPDVLDVVGAIVLAANGRRALAAALAGRDFEPTRPCFLNPLHGPSAGSSRIERNGTRVGVPLCKACRADLRAKRRPDTLDVLRDNEPVHYFDTDDEPWASTGYGALEPDLVGRLHGAR